MAAPPGMRKEEHNWEWGIILRAITVPANEVYMKASREFMKSNDVSIPVEQLDGLIKEPTGQAYSLATVTRAKGNSGLGWPLPQLCPGLMTVPGDIEHARLWAASLCLPCQEGEEPIGFNGGRRLPWAVLKL